MIAAEQASRDIMEMDERGAVVERESSHYAKRRLLVAGRELRPLRQPVELKVEAKRRADPA